MADHVSTAEIQQWINNSRLTIATVDTELESSAFSRVSSALALRYDTTTWSDEDTTPDLIRSIISMFIAAWIINRTFAETDNDLDAYGLHLESSALDLLGGLADGSILLDDTPGAESTSTGTPSFWPTDSATEIAETEGNDAEGAAGLMFKMGMSF